jgi:hypothetical protein
VLGDGLDQIADLVTVEAGFVLRVPWLTLRRFEPHVALLGSQPRDGLRQRVASLPMDESCRADRRC